MTSVLEMKTLSKPSEEQKSIDELGKRIDEINHSLGNAQQAYEDMQKQTSNAKGTVNKEAHKEDLKNLKSEMDKLEKMKKKLKYYIYRLEKEIAEKSKKGGRRTRKKRGKRSRRRKRKRKKRRTRRAGMLPSTGQTKSKKESLNRLKRLNETLKARMKTKGKLETSQVFKDPFTKHMEAFNERMSPINFTKTTSIGGKKTRKKRRRKRRR